MTIDGATYGYYYNEDGLRALKTLADGSKERYYYNGSQLEMLIRYNPNGTVAYLLKYIYNASGQLEYILRKKDNFLDSKRFDLFYCAHNGKGEITRLIKTRYQTSTGVGSTFFIAANYDYDAYGNVTVSSPVDDDIGWLNPIRYKDYFYDTETNWYYLQSRYYDPVVGRFISGDCLINQSSFLGYNIFAYCFNNPILLVDPNGTCPYNGTVADFHRLEHGLPSLDCICNQKEVTIPSGGISVHKGKIRICTDGSDGSKVPDNNWQPETAYSHKGKPLNAYTVPYVVIPIKNHSARLGDSALLINHDTGMSVMCVIGERGPASNGWGEVSIAAIWKTGNSDHMSANHASGLSENYEIIIYPDVRYDFGD